MGGVDGCCAGWCYATWLLGGPYDGSWCLVYELCQMTVVCVDFRCSRCFVFLSVPGFWGFLRVTHILTRFCLHAHSRTPGCPALALFYMGGDAAVLVTFCAYTIALHGVDDRGSSAAQWVGAACALSTSVTKF